MRTITTVLLTLGVTGCVVYDEQLVRDTAAEAPRGGERPGGDRDDPAPETEALWLNPAGGVQGDVLILSLVSDGSVDLGRVAELEFFGDAGLEILTTAGRGAREHLLTIEVPATAAASDNHLLVTLDDGTSWFVEDAFAVVGDPAEIPPSEEPPGDGGDGCP